MIVVLTLDRTFLQSPIIPDARQSHANFESSVSICGLRHCGFHQSSNLLAGCFRYSHRLIHHWPRAVFRCLLFSSICGLRHCGFHRSSDLSVDCFGISHRFSSSSVCALSIFSCFPPSAGRTASLVHRLQVATREGGTMSRMPAAR